MKRLRMACNPNVIWYVGCYNSITPYGQISPNRPCLQCWVKARAHTHSCQQRQRMEEGIPGFQLMTSISYQMYHLKIFFFSLFGGTSGSKAQFSISKGLALPQHINQWINSRRLTLGLTAVMWLLAAWEAQSHCGEQQGAFILLKRECQRTCVF